MKRKIWQAFVVAGLMLFLSRTAVQRDLQASAFQEKIEQCLKAGELPVVVLSQESGEYESIGKSALWAAEYAAAQVNKNGGVNGCNVRIVSENTSSDNSKALSLYQGASRKLLLQCLARWMHRRQCILHKMQKKMGRSIWPLIHMRNPDSLWHRMEFLI